ncbi:A-agglutinin anchorage subunit-like [Thrips palmi]|uniref:A-agglutinin anchorage subunit-like n=1 Tax=Thrips palmi TaxID=161013 RepID=A0A6P9AD93_THRPL|nr:A-agglutinin anchorage subunit-like [Thrips palmi]
MAQPEQSPPTPRRKRTSQHFPATMRIPTAIVPLAVLCALAATVQAKSATHLKDAADDYCASCVDGDAPRYQPVRGADEVRICEDGYYCDCQAGRKLKCATVFWVHGNFDPDRPDSACSITHSCLKWFEDHPLPTPASPTTSPASSSPSPASSSVSPSSSSPSPASSSISPPSTSPSPASSSLSPSSTSSPVSSSLSPSSNSPATASSSAHPSSTFSPASSSLSPSSKSPSPISSSLSPSSSSPSPASSSVSPLSTSPSPISSSLSPSSTSSPVTSSLSPSSTSPASSSLSPSSTSHSPASSSLYPSSTTSTTTTSSPSTPVPSSTCLPTKCPWKLSLMLPDPADCQRYIRCHQGQSWNMACAPGTWFSFSRQACVYLSQSDCVQNE